MAGEAGQPSSGLSYEQLLADQALEFDFFQVLRRLEALYPERPGFGRSSRPVEDPARLGQEPALEFAPTMLKEYLPATDARPAKLSSYFFGLFGPNGPVPLHLTEYAQQRKLNSRDATLTEFVDLFHHRMFSLLYRAWASSRPTVSLDRPASDRYQTYVGALFGLGMPSVCDRDELPDVAKLHFAGVLAMQNRPAEGLQVMLEQFFRLPVRILQFLGGWMTLPFESRMRLGESEETGLLGQTAVIGSSVWGCQHRFRIVLGPLDFAEFQRMLPGQSSLRRLVAIVRNYLGDEWEWDVQLVLKRRQVPAVGLGRSGELGWTSWLGLDERAADRDDVVLTLGSDFAESRDTPGEERENG